MCGPSVVGGGGTGPELNLGGGGIEARGGGGVWETLGVVSPPVGGGSRGLPPEKTLKK